VLSGHRSVGAQLAGSTPLPGTTTTAESHPVANVRAFGAVGDGSTDDTAAIQDAIASLGTTGGTVYFPIGDYFITSALTISTAVELLGESLNARILAQAEDSAIKVADTATHNSDITIRRISVVNNGSTPIWVDSRYMTYSGIVNCIISGFTQYGIYYGGNTNETNASWSNFVEGTGIYNIPTCIYLNGVHSRTSDGPTNWITIERCLIIPNDTIDGIGIDLVNGGAARVINNDIVYAPNATAIMLRQRTNDVFEHNRLEDIGQVAPSHPIEKEYGHATFQIVGVMADIYYQRAEYLEFTGEPTGGIFTLTRGSDTTGAIDFATDETTLADNILLALESLAGVGAGNVEVTAENATLMRIAWLNGRGRSNRPNLTADASGLTGDESPGITVIQGSHADAIRRSDDVALAGVINDTEMTSLADMGPHLDLGIPLVTRQPIVAVGPDESIALQLQREDEHFPRLGLSVNVHIQWMNTGTGETIGGLSLLSNDPNAPRVGWDDNLNVALPRHTRDFDDSDVADNYRGAIFRQERGPGARDQLRVGITEADEQTHVRQLYPGFMVSENLDVPIIAAWSMVAMTITATGAQVGDAVVVTPPADLADGLIATGVVSNTNTVTIRLFNGSGETLGPAESTWSVLILQP
jgi:hypothetical protein